MNIDHKLDIASSIIVRLKATDENGKGKCPLCNNDITYWTLVCGHFIKRRHTRTRWYLPNLEAICPECNGKEEATLAEPMRDYKISTLGFKKVEEMEREINTPFKWFNYDKEQLLKEFRIKIRELLEDKNFEIQIP